MKDEERKVKRGIEQYKTKRYESKLRERKNENQGQSEVRGIRHKV